MSHRLTFTEALLTVTERTEFTSLPMDGLSKLRTHTVQDYLALRKEILIVVRMNLEDVTLSNIIHCHQVPARGRPWTLLIPTG